MPSLAIDDSDGSVQFFYLDSGQPQRQNHGVYTTLVIIHGNTFHSGIFQRILPLASEKGLRLICVNRRDYAGTTLYTPSELKVLSDGDEAARSAFLEARGIEIALFLNRIIDKLSLPAPTADSRDGGLAIMGWSLGNMVSTAVVAAGLSLPDSVRVRLQVYVRRLIMHNPPSVALGIKDPPLGYTPLHDDEIPKEERLTAFTHWASSYYTHGNLSTHNPNNLEYKNPDPTRKSTVASMSTQEYDSVVDVMPAWRSEVFFHARFETALFRQTCKALFDPGTRALWGALKIYLLHGDSSPWAIICAAWEVENLARVHKGQAVEVTSMKDAHTFVFWDQPEKALDAYVYCLRN